MRTQSILEKLQNEKQLKKAIKPTKKQLIINMDMSLYNRLKKACGKKGLKITPSVCAIIQDYLDNNE